MRALRSADVAVFMATEASELDIMGPVVIFNPKQERGNFDKMSSFVGSSYVCLCMGLEIGGERDVEQQESAVFKCVIEGVLNLSGKNWTVRVEKEPGKLRVEGFSGKTPSLAQVENVLYNQSHDYSLTSNKICQLIDRFGCKL